MNDQLRARIEKLEAQYETQRQATLAWGKDVDKHSRWIDGHLKRIMALEAAQKIRSGPESPLVERVADAIAAEATSAGIVNDRPARAAIREVAEWLKENRGPNSAWPAVARDLMDGAKPPEGWGKGCGEEGSLVERICIEAGIHNPADARAVIREVAAALIDWHNSDLVVRTAWEAGKWLEQQAKQ